MKNLIPNFFLLLIFIACKKQEPETSPVTDPCPIYSKIFEGSYTINRPNHDTINIVFTRNYCPNNAADQYKVTGLNEAVQPNCACSNHTLTPNYVYYLISNEQNKTGYLTGYNNSFIRKDNDSVLYVVLPTEGEYYFTKIH